MTVARNSFCRKYFGTDREYLTAEEIKEYWRIAKKISRMSNPEKYEREKEYNKRYFQQHKEHLLECARRNKIQNMARYKQNHMIRFIKKHGHKPFEGGKFFKKYGVRYKDAPPEILRKFNNERLKKYRQKVAQTFDKDKTQV